LSIKFLVLQFCALAVNAKGGVVMDGGFLLFDAAHVREAGAFPEEVYEFGELRGGADGVDFDAAVVEIAGVAGQTELGGGAFDEVAESDALDASADVVEFGGFGHESIMAGPDEL
jgi:hypothetical protein